MPMFHSVLFRLHCELVYGKENNDELGGTMIEMYTNAAKLY